MSDREKIAYDFWERWEYGRLIVYNPMPPDRFVDGVQLRPDDLKTWRDAVLDMVGIDDRVEDILCRSETGKAFLSLVKTLAYDIRCVETVPCLQRVVRVFVESAG